MTKRTAYIMIGIVISIIAIVALARTYPPILIWAWIGIVVVTGGALVLLLIWRILLTIAINIEIFIWGEEKVD